MTNLLRKTLKLGDEKNILRTSIKLEPEYWCYMANTIAVNKKKISQIVTEIIAGRTPFNRASFLRVFILRHAIERAEKAELASELDPKILFILMEKTPSGIACINKCGKVVYFNEVFAKLLNIEASAKTGWLIDSILKFCAEGRNGQRKVSLFKDIKEGPIRVKYVAPPQEKIFEQGRVIHGEKHSLLFLN